MRCVVLPFVHAAIGVALLTAAAGTISDAQPANPHRRYAQRITQHADSAAYIVAFQLKAVEKTMAKDPNTDLFGLIAFLGGNLERPLARKVGDFDAVVPPTNYASVHRQMATALKALAVAQRRLSEAAALMKCTRPDCGPPSLRAPAFEAALGEVERALVDYGQARDRAGRLLTEHEVTLPEPKQPPDSPPPTSP
jgi:hypothetical protein